jgi:DNA polymerase III subunit gamma/tau
LVRAILARFPGAEIVDVRDSLAASDDESDENAAVPQDFDPESSDDDDPFEFLDSLQDDGFRPA